MKKFDFYEFTGVIAPGAIVIYGLARIYPETGFLVEIGKLTAGDLGLFVILSYVVGHLVQAFGAIIESVWWRRSGLPSDWPRTGKHSLLAQQQDEILPEAVRSKLRINLPANLSDLDKEDWLSITRQIYAVVRKDGRADRVDIFNGNYGMFRGLTAGFLVLLGAAIARFGWCAHHRLYAALFFAALLSLLRMHRFGKHYARELFVQFLSVNEHSPRET